MSANARKSWDGQPMIDIGDSLAAEIIRCECGVEFIPPLFMRRCSNCQAERAFEAARPQRKRAAA